ncbi:MAG: methyltransferase domain-containing protein [Chitinophagales bacterium]|nr:methyltransferase domain-containing protein [Chitinophagales bacterium]
MELTPDYWNQRYLNDETQWDIGYASPAIVKFVNKLSNKQAKILIPGGGNGHEAAYLHKNGFQQVFLLDWAASALHNFHTANPQFPVENLLQDDFFKHQGNYDLIIEQTFFCALNPSLRSDYAQHMHRLLNDGGLLVGLLFDDALNTDHPPFGGHLADYLLIFEPWFKVLKMEPCTDSIPPRAGRELWIELKKK